MTTIRKLVSIILVNSSLVPLPKGIWSPNVSTGEKEVDYESEHWCDWDERCHGNMESFINNPDYASGFIWSCCDGAGDAEGCVRSRHEAKEGGRR